MAAVRMCYGLDGSFRGQPHIADPLLPPPPRATHCSPAHPGEQGNPATWNIRQRLAEHPSHMQLLDAGLRRCAETQGGGLPRPVEKRLEDQRRLVSERENVAAGLEQSGWQAWAEARCAELALPAANHPTSADKVGSVFVPVGQAFSVFVVLYIVFLQLGRFDVACRNCGTSRYQTASPICLTHLAGSSASRSGAPSLSRLHPGCGGAPIRRAGRSRDGRRSPATGSTPLPACAPTACHCSA